MIKPCKDGRSVAGKRYTEATTRSKPTMAANMMKRSLRAGIDADYLLADAWFGTRPMIRTALALDNLGQNTVVSNIREYCVLTRVFCNMYSV